ncbi:MAG: type II secretion system protein GspC [Candidatus Binataceae bacterium]
MEFRLNQRHIVAFNFLLIAGIAYFAARSVNDIFLQSLQGAPAVPAPVSADIGGTQNYPRDYYNQIVSRDVFNLTPQEASEPVISTVDLHLKLLGTSLATRDRPFAIIEDQSGDQSLYTLGDDIPGAGRLVSVQKSRILIQHEGQQVALEIPSDDLPEGVQSAPVTQSLTGRRRPLAPGVAQRGKGKPGDDDDEPDINVDEEGENRYGLKRNEIKDALAHSASLFTEIRAVPNIQNGKQMGFTLSDIEPGSVFEDLGLEEGDQLTEIDGKPLENPGEAIGLLSTIQTRSAINITVMRDGHPVQLQYNIH